MATVDSDPELHGQRAQELARATHIGETFQKLGLPVAGNPGTLLHIHHTGLGAYYYAQPSGQDLQVSERGLAREENGTEHRSSKMGVVTKKPDGELAINIVKTFRDTDGTVKHEHHSPIIIESDLTKPKTDTTPEVIPLPGEKLVDGPTLTTTGPHADSAYEPPNLTTIGPLSKTPSPGEGIIDTPKPETTETKPPTAEAIKLTGGGDVIQEIQQGLRSAENDSVVFEGAPNVLIPFITQKMQEGNLTIKTPLSAVIADKPDGSGKQMQLKGAVSQYTVNVALDVTLENENNGLKVVENSTQARGIGSGYAKGKISDAMTNLDATMKAQITKALGNVGQVESIQIGDGMLKVTIKK